MKKLFISFCDDSSVEGYAEFVNLRLIMNMDFFYLFKEKDDLKYSALIVTKYIKAIGEISEKNDADEKLKETEEQPCY